MRSVHSPHFFRTLSMAGYCVVAIVVCGIVLGRVARQRQVAPPTFNDPNERVLLTVHGVKIVKCMKLRTTGLGGEIQGDEANDADIASFLHLITKEFDELPSSLIAQSRLRKVKVCENLKLDDLPRGGCSCYVDMSIYINLFDSINRPKDIISAIRHELFHVLDKEFYLIEVSRISWERLNNRGFTYGRGPSSMQNVPDALLPVESIAGFVNKYSTCDPGEDRAEVFAFMMGSPLYVSERMKSDIVLRTKVKTMKQMLHNWCADMDEMFWQRRGLSVPRD
jgi:hypothetical protein